MDFCAQINVQLCENSGKLAFSIMDFGQTVHMRLYLYCIELEFFIIQASTTLSMKGFHITYYYIDEVNQCIMGSVLQDII